NIIPVTLELGGKSPNIFAKDVMDADDEYLDKAIEGLVMFALNQGEVCTCPSRALVHEDIFDEFMERVIKRVEEIKVGNPLDANSMSGSEASNEHKEKIASYLDIRKIEGAEILSGGNLITLDGDIKDGYYFEPTIFIGNNKMRFFREEIFGPVLAVATY